MRGSPQIAGDAEMPLDEQPTPVLTARSDSRRVRSLANLANIDQLLDRLGVT